MHRYSQHEAGKDISATANQAAAGGPARSTSTRNIGRFSRSLYVGMIINVFITFCTLNLKVAISLTASNDADCACKFFGAATPPCLRWKKTQSRIPKNETDMVPIIAPSFKIFDPIRLLFIKPGNNLASSSMSRSFIRTVLQVSTANRNTSCFVMGRRCLNVQYLFQMKLLVAAISTT